MNVIDIINEIKKVALENKNRPKSQKTHFVTQDTKSFRQGDLYVFRVDDDHPVGDVIKRNQLADGLSLGARHILNGNFKVYKGAKAPKVVREPHATIGLGYAFDVEETTVLVHPEHDNYVFKTCGRFQVMHQIDLRTVRKAAD